MHSAARLGARVVASRWAPRSRLLLVADGAGWSIAHDMRELAAIANRLGVRVADRRFLNASHGQAAFYGSQFALLRRDAPLPPHALGTAYFHGRPGTPGMPEFDECFAALQQFRERIERVQVTHREMHDLVLAAGVAAEKVHLIRIGVDAGVFARRTPGEREAARARLGIPGTAFAVGSFQKDGVGWGEGLEPKLIKGPDVLVAALARLREAVPELLVVLSGPARGYVMRELEQLGIPYVHRRVASVGDLRELYCALDTVAVASRQEGGPKAVLEGMAVGVPVVSTRVGQAQELIDGGNGLLVDVEDVEGLTAALADAAAHGDDWVDAGRRTAEANAYGAQLPQWAAFFDGFVRR